MEFTISDLGLSVEELLVSHLISLALEAISEIAFTESASSSKRLSPL